MHYAIVIGCDSYWAPERSLMGAVTDASRMWTWLTSPAGAAIRPANIVTLLSRGGRVQDPPGLRVDGRAANSEIQQAIARILQMSGGVGDRFYFYFAGHGITGRLHQQDEPAIVPEDFTPTVTDRSITIRSIAERFAASGFREQFFFVDACRDVPFDGEFAVGTIARTGMAQPGATVDQRICFATSPRGRAVELQGSGLMTSALLDGLRGDGRAKVWDDEHERYVVRWNELFSYVEERVVSEQHAAGAEHGYIQRPRQGGEHGSTNPLLATFPEDAFGDLALDLAVEPVEAAATTIVHVAELAREVTTVGPLHSPTCTIRLRPRTYSVRARAAAHVPTRTVWRVDLYEPSRLSIEFAAAKPSPPPETGTLIGPTPVNDGESRGQLLTVTAADPLAVVEVVDQAGRCVALGAGSVEVRAEGWFRAHVLTPEGAGASRDVEVLGDQQVQVEVDAPPADPTLDTLARRLAVRASGRDDGADTVTTPQPSTVLCLAAFAEMQHAAIEGFPPGLGRNSGVRAADVTPVVVITDERQLAVEHDGPGDRLHGVDGGEDTPVHVVAELAPGPRRLVVWGAHEVITLAVWVPPGVPLLVIVTHTDGRLAVTQLAQPLGGGKETVRAVRRFELAQRFARGGQFGHAELLLDDPQVSDVLALCLDAYLRVRLGRRGARLSSLVKRLLAVAPGLPDTHILAGIVDGTRQADRAKVTHGLELGSPVFDLGLRMAADVMGWTSVDASDARVPGQIFTVLDGNGLSIADAAK